MTGGERFRKITEHGVITVPSGTGAVMIHTEESRDCYLVLLVLRLADKARKVAIVTLEWCEQSVSFVPLTWKHCA